MLPKVIIHNAVSLDARIDNFMPDIELFYQLIGRWNEDATLAGSNTMLNPPDVIPPETPNDFLPVKIQKNDNRPILVIPDSRGRVRNWHYWKNQPYWKNHIALCTKTTPQDHFDYLDQRNIPYLVTGEKYVDYKKVFAELQHRYKVQTIRVDSGGTLNGVLLRQGLVHEVSVLIHPKLIGGTSPMSFFRADDLKTPNRAIDLKLKHFEQLKDEIIWLIYDVVKKECNDSL